MGRWMLLLACLAPWGAAEAENLIRNGGFELPWQVGSTKMLQGQEPMQYHWGDGHTMFISWQPTGAEGWWSVGLHPGPDHLRLLDDPAQAHSGRHALRLTAQDKPVGVVCGAGQMLPVGKVTFSLWLRGAGAAGRVRFDALPDNSNMSAGFLQESATARCELPLPAGEGWQRLAGTIDVPAGAPQQMVVRVQVTRGTLWLDDVQVEPGDHATPFNARPAEQITVAIDTPRTLPVFVADRGQATARVSNTSTVPLSGDLTVSVARFDGAEPRLVWSGHLDAWPPGATISAELPLAGLRPDAYVLYARLIDQGRVVLDGLANFDGQRLAGGMISKAMVQAPCVARFAVTDSRPNRELFGSGNMMVNTGGGWWGGYPVADYLEARELGFRYSRERTDDDSTYRLAAGAMRAVGDGPRPWTASDDLPADCRNPLKTAYADLSDPRVWPYLERMWRKLGADLADNPVFPLLHITGEEMVLYQGALCPTKAADADFRGWVQRRYGSLEAVSAAWGRPVAAWGDIEQIISARMVDERLVKVQKEQEKAVDWLGAADKLSAEQGALLKADPGRGMDWLSWRNDVYLNTVSRLAKAFHQANPRTLLCNHFCWPDFVPQTTYGLARRLDALGIDTQYPCGLPGSLGTPAETIDMLGIYEAFADQRPVWGHEIYIQPTFPAEMPATQIWGLIAHGMKVVDNFAWKPYSDAGQKAKRWTEPGAPPWWCVMDFDGKHLPTFAPLARATREVNGFDERYHGATLRRAKPDAAFFVSQDAGVLSHFETLGQWWNSPIVHARCELGWLLRLAGVSLDYLDDELLAERLGDYRVVFAPYSPNVNDQSLARLAEFARRGGTVVFAGPAGWQDPWLKPRANVGGAAFAELGWKVSDYAPTPAAKVAGSGPLAALGPLSAVSGQGRGELPGGEVLLQADGAPIGWRKAFGRGQVIALTAFPEAYSQSPHADPANLELGRQLATVAGVRPRAQWRGADAPTPGKLAGEGAPVVDVMVRQKSDRELFLFLLNIGGAGAGELRLNLPGQWSATDALQPAAPTPLAAVLPLTLKPWEYRVWRLTR
jgi:hypothetical protein